MFSADASYASVSCQSNNVGYALAHFNISGYYAALAIAACTMYSVKRAPKRICLTAWGKAIKSDFKKMASDKNHRPCLPLKPQEKKF